MNWFIDYLTNYISKTIQIIEYWNIQILQHWNACNIGILKHWIKEISENLNIGKYKY